MGNSRLTLVRVLGILAVSFGILYLGWRWFDTIAWNAWWIAVPLVIAETYSFGESLLFTFTMWNAKRRKPAPTALPGRTVDVFIATYNEPLELVLKTALAARNMSYPHKTWILDDGARPEFRDMADHLGIGYISRGAEWEGRKRFAKAGNVNNALFKTSGELVAILDADQVPEKHFLDRVIGYFEDETVAFVQTPQRFWNVPGSDPLGAQAELFYGPIQQGKDGWGAAFFCGSNAILRREALMALGLSKYARDAAGRCRAALRAGKSRLTELLSECAVRAPSAMPTVERALVAIYEAERQLRRGDVLSEITYDLASRFHHALLDSPELPSDIIPELDDVLESIDVARTDQALAILPIDTSSITEDMATAMNLHALGWDSVYHHEVLVHGLAPEEISVMLSQRQRWAAGTMQVFFANNPMTKRGLTFPQRLMYLATMTSYLNGFAAIVYIAAPVIFLTTGIFPIHAISEDFFYRFIPFFVLCQLLFLVSGHRSQGLWRGQQMSFALFPTWIKATISGASAVFLGRRLTFSVTSKDGASGTNGYRYVLPQIGAIALLVGASVIGVLRTFTEGVEPFPTYLSLIWVSVDVALLWSVVRAARYQGPGDAVKDPANAVTDPADAIIGESLTPILAAIRQKSEPEQMSSQSTST